MKLVSLAVLALVTVASAASQPPQNKIGPEPERAAHIRARLAERFPDVKINAVRQAPIAGLYEVFTPGEVVYVDEDADYLLTGKLLTTKDRRNLSAESWDEFNRIDFAQLPLEAAIPVVRGSGARKLAVFSDPHCPFCRDLEKELATLDDATIYVFLFPLEELHKGATERARAIWCSSDRQSTWRAWMLESKTPSPEACAMDPVAANQALGKRLNVTVTPTVFFADGTRVTGARPKADLDKLLRERTAATTTTAASGR